MTDVLLGVDNLSCQHIHIFIDCPRFLPRKRDCVKHGRLIFGIHANRFSSNLVKDNCWGNRENTGVGLTFPGYHQVIYIGSPFL